MYFHEGVRRGSVLVCGTCNLQVQGSISSGSSRFFRGSILGHDTSEPQPRTGEAQGIHGFVSCHHDMTEVML